MISKKQKILVAMSGGVDSSVAAFLLVNAGYDVTGAFMVNYDSPVSPSAREGVRGSGSCWRKDYQDALRVAAKLGIPLLRLDFQKEYKKKVLDYMYKEYRAGRTPNPDVLCNKFVKFGVWLKVAKKLGFDKLATGHYSDIKTTFVSSSGRKKKQPSSRAQVERKNKKTFCLICAKDENKDQTYFLHQLNQAQLKHILFPLGQYTKVEVRQLAKKFKLPTAKKEESMGICFVGEVPMKEFLEKKIKVKKGEIILSDGTIVGEHEGLAFYTIGQRHLGTMGGGRALFVVDKNIKKNQLVVGYEDDPLLYKKQILVEQVNWIRQKSKFPLKCLVRLRHRQSLQQAVVFPLKKGGGKRILVVNFIKPQRAITPGQFAVFYKNNECLGGGVIK